MQSIKLFTLGLLLFFAGLTAGQMYHEMAGAQEALTHVDNATYLNYWKSLDSIFAVRMPIAANFLFLLFVINITLFWAEVRTWPYWLLVLSLFFFVVETIITVKLQLPINHQMQNFKTGALPANFLEYKDATFKHFIIRSILRFTAFLMLIIASFKLIIQIKQTVIKSQ